MRNDIRALPLADFTALGRQSEEQAVYLLQSLLLDEQACRLRLAWLRQAARRVRARFPELTPTPRPEFLGRVLGAVDDPGIISAWREGKVTFAELEAMTRAPHALYEAHCRLLDRDPEPWPGAEEDMVTETEVPPELWTLKDTTRRLPMIPDWQTDCVSWYHVTPLFLFPRILGLGGLRCGADLAATRSPRRSSSRAADDTPCDELGGLKPSDCILLFRRKAPPLLDEKLRGHRVPKHVRRPWKAYPHIRLDFPAQYCLDLVAGGQVYGSPDNVGRTLQGGKQPCVKLYTSVAAVRDADVREIMIPASSLGARGRCLPLGEECRIVTFSKSDQDLVREHLSRVNCSLTVTLEEKPRYAESQRTGPGVDRLSLTRQFFNAIWSGDEERQAGLIEQLARECFD